MGRMKKINIPSVDEVRIIGTADGEIWVNLNDLIVASHFTKELFDKEISEKMKNIEDFSDKEEMSQILKIYDGIMDDVIEALEEINRQSEVEKMVKKK